jgi:hypothetical protein
MPELLKSILSTKSQNDYFQGLYDGNVEFEKSKVKSRSQELKNLRFRKGRNKNKGLER